MRSVSIVSKRIIRIISVSLAYHGKKKKFLNSFVSLTTKRIISIIFTCVCLSYYLAFFKDKKIILPDLAKRKGMISQELQDDQCKRRGLTIGILFQEINRLLGQKAMNPLEQAKRELRPK